MGSVLTRPVDNVTEISLLAGLPYIEFSAALVGGGFGAALNFGILDAAAIAKTTAIKELTDYGSGTGRLVRELVGELKANIKVGVFNWEASLFRYAIASATLTDLNAGSQSIVDEGFTLNGPADPDGDLFVAEACSGLRSLMALLTLGVVFAHFFRRGLPVQQVVLVLSTIPIAILVNAMRVALSGFLAHYYGQEAAGGFIHEFQGMITFSVAFFLLLGLARLFDQLSRALEARNAA